MQEESIFRKSSLDRLSSPEQLDQLLQVTAPKDWLALASFVVLLVCLGAWMVMGSLPTTVQGNGILMRKGSVRRVVAQQGGVLQQFLVNYGGTVAAGQVVAELQTGPDANTLEQVKSLYAGVVVKKGVAEGDLVNPGGTLLVLEPVDPTLEVVMYMPLMQGKAVRTGMGVQVSPSTAPREVYGFLPGTVRRVAHFPSPETGMLDTLGDEELVKYFLGSSTGTQVVPLEILVDLVRDRSTPSGYHWSSSQGPPRTMSPETLCTASIVLDTERPLSLLVPQTGGDEAAPAPASDAAPQP